MSDTIYIVGSSFPCFRYIGTDEDDAKDAARDIGNDTISVFVYGSRSRDVEAETTFDLSGYPGSTYVVGSDASNLDYAGDDPDAAISAAMESEADVIYVYDDGSLRARVEAEKTWDL